MNILRKIISRLCVGIIVLSLLSWTGINEDRTASEPVSDKGEVFTVVRVTAKDVVPLTSIPEEFLSEKQRYLDGCHNGWEHVGKEFFTEIDASGTILDSQRGFAQICTPRESFNMGFLYGQMRAAELLFTKVHNTTSDLRKEVRSRNQSNTTTVPYNLDIKPGE